MPETDKNKLAVALKYERDKREAPHVAAKGKGYIAEQIIRIAEEHGIEIREDRDLAQMLSKVDIDAPIPIEAYSAVAEMLAYIYRANNRMREGK
jgi:flagellar biosynthesis protein